MNKKMLGIMLTTLLITAAGCTENIAVTEAASIAPVATASEYCYKIGNNTYDEKFLMSLSATSVRQIKENVLKAGIKDKKVVDKMVKLISKLNVNRGGENGFGGFVAEHIQAERATINGNPTKVIDDNGIADLVVKNRKQSPILQQLKVGYDNGNIDIARYKGQEVLINSDHPKLDKLIYKGAQEKIKVSPALVTKKETNLLANTMQFEGKFTGSNTSKIATKAFGEVEKVRIAGNVGLKATGAAAALGGGFSLGENIVKVAKGEKNISEAAKDVAVDTAVSGVVGYGAGVVATALADTAVGSAVITGAAAVEGAVAGTTVGAALVTGATTTTAAIAGASTAAATATVGTLATAGGAAAGALTSMAAGTAAAGAVSSGIATAAAVGTAAAGTFIAAAPFVAVGAVLGIGYAVLSGAF